MSLITKLAGHLSEPLHVQGTGELGRALVAFQYSNVRILTRQRHSVRRMWQTGVVGHVHSMLNCSLCSVQSTCAAAEHLDVRMLTLLRMSTRGVIELKGLSDEP